MLVPFTETSQGWGLEIVGSVGGMKGSALSTSTLRCSLDSQVEVGKGSWVCEPGARGRGQYIDHTSSSRAGRGNSGRECRQGGRKSQGLCSGSTVFGEQGASPGDRGAVGLEASAWPPSPPHTLSHGGGMCLLTAFSSLIHGMRTLGSAHPCQGAQSPLNMWGKGTLQKCPAETRTHGPHSGVDGNPCPNSQMVQLGDCRLRWDLAAA